MYILCKANSKMDSPPPLQPSPIPQDPWQTLNIDFLGPPPNQNYLLVVVDQFSRFPEVEITNTTATGPTLEALTKIFSTHRLPYKVITHNGSPFISWGFKEYMKKRELFTIKLRHFKEYMKKRELFRRQTQPQKIS